jgi:hypothetical protein
VIPDLAPINGVPDQLIRALNERFRMIPEAAATVSTQANTTTIVQAPATSILVVDRTLASASTTINAPDQLWDILVEVFRQDGAGGRAIVWGSGFEATSTSLGQALANTMCSFTFAHSRVSGKFVLIAESPKDMTP